MTISNLKQISYYDCHKPTILRNKDYVIKFTLYIYSMN